MGEKDKVDAIFKATEEVIAEGGNAKLSEMADEIAKRTEEYIK